MRNLRIGEDVLGRNGERLGSVDRLVVDEAGQRVTHLVVDDHLIGVGRVRDVKGRLATELGPDDLLRLPEAHPGLVDEPGSNWSAPGGYRLEHFLRIASALIGQTPYVPPVHLDLDLSAMHEISPGSPVWSGRQQVGTVSSVLTDDSGAVTGLVLQRPGILGIRSLVPVDHVTEVIGTNVHVDLTEQEIDGLPDYAE